jgi:hypothetical protein
MIKFESVQITPSTVYTGESYIIRVKAKSIKDVFKFPLIIPKILGIIFKRGDSNG